MVIHHWFFQDPFGVLDIVNCPIDGMSRGILVDLEHEVYQKLSVAKNSAWELEVRSGVDKGLQAVYCIPHCETPS